ncbi:MAG: non-canonical purine NTP pyrophosphatase [Gemmatimonadota bacterium]
MVATRSHGKLLELRPLLTEAGYRVLTLEDVGIAASPDEDAVEAFQTFGENAQAKARYFRRRTGKAVVADDSGLELVGLAGAPGVRSRRWAMRPGLEGGGLELDRANNEMMLTSLVGKDRTARYVCAAAFSDGTKEVVTEGVTEGRMLEVGRGQNGFGYDPYFLSLELGCTFAEASREEKEVVSHRGRAFRELMLRLGER